MGDKELVVCDCFGVLCRFCCCFCWIILGFLREVFVSFVERFE